VFKVDLGGGAELRPLEPWQAEEFLAHMDRARETVDPWIPWASVSADLAGARKTLQRYADLQARDAGRLYGIWLDGVLVGGTMFVSFDARDGDCEIGCWLEPAATGRAWSPRRFGGWSTMPWSPEASTASSGIAAPTTWPAPTSPAASA